MLNLVVCIVTTGPRKINLSFGVIYEYIEQQRTGIMQ